MGGWSVLLLNKVYQHSLAGVEAGAELGKYQNSLTPAQYRTSHWTTQSPEGDKLIVGLLLWARIYGVMLIEIYYTM